MKKYLILFCYLSLFTNLFCKNSCHNMIKEKIDNLVIITNNSPIQESFSTPGGLTKQRSNLSLFQYNDEYKIQTLIYSHVKKDTIIINQKSEFIEIRFNFKGCESMYFLLKNKDTVFIDFDSIGYPHLKSSISDTYTRFYNFQSTINYQKLKWDFEPLTLYYDFGHHLRIVSLAKTKAPDIFDKLKSDYVNLDTLNSACKEYFKNFELKLNDIIVTDTISKRYFSYYSYLLNRKKWLFYIAESNYDRRNSSSLTATDQNSSIYNFLNDDFINLQSYSSFLNNILFTYLTRYYKVSQLKVKNYNYIDYKSLFNHISSDKQIPTLSRNLMLLYTINEINQYFDVNDINDYKNRFLKITGDSNAVKHILALNVEKKEIIIKKTDIQLKDISGKILTFNDVLEKNKGKIIYVDFWATWCAPCIQGMSNSKKLRQLYANKNIVFIYLAKNDDYENWKVKSNQFFGESKKCESYFIVNYKTSKTLKEYEVETIPRFLLFDKNGFIIHKNAPRPHSKEIQVLFNKYDK